MTTYRIVRSYSPETGRRAQVIDEGLTLEEARAHCKREDTHGPGWFDGYEEED